jgi:hypothetical protein
MVTTLTACIVIPLLLLVWSHGGSLRRSPWPALLVVLWYGFPLAHIAFQNIRHPQEWDYGCFWLYGHIAAGHLNLYDPAVFANFTTPFTPSDDFRAAVLNVGFPDPPPTIALFLPLGFIPSLSIGLALWYAVQFAALGGAAWVLARTFMPADGWRSAGLVLAIIVALPPAIANVGDAQTNFLLLLLVALALQTGATARGAVWQALAIWVKPFTAALFLVDALRGRWNRLIVGGLTVLGSVAVGALIVGPASVMTYLRSNPAGREPGFAFVEIVNQSLLAVVLRLHAVLPQHISPLHEPLYLAGALFFVAVTLALCVQPGVSSDVAFGASLLLGLIVYPGTLSSYGVIVAIPLLIVWKYRETFPGRTLTVCGIIALTVFLESLWLQRGFEASVVAWIACSYLLLVQRGAAREPRAALTLRPAGPARVEIAR